MFSAQEAADSAADFTQQARDQLRIPSESSTSPADRALTFAVLAAGHSITSSILHLATAVSSLAEEARALRYKD